MQFAPVTFPPNVNLDNRRAFTILDSNTDQVFLDVAMSAETGREWGDLYTSNSNGTFYTLSVQHTNRSPSGLVDFERNEALHGVSLLNVVTNVAELSSQGGEKSVQSRITFNDGGLWQPLKLSLSSPSDPQQKQPASDDCSEGRCLLHLHSQATLSALLASLSPFSSNPIASVSTTLFSRKSAPGQVLGMGNSGSGLKPYNSNNANLFYSRDGGHFWHHVLSGPHLWEMGDRGGVVVAVPHLKPTSTLLYSLDDCNTWIPFTFYSKLVVVTRITAEPSVSGFKFLLIAELSDESTGLSGLGSLGRLLESLLSGRPSMSQFLIQVFNFLPSVAYFNDSTIYST